MNKNKERIYVYRNYRNVVTGSDVLKLYPNPGVQTKYGSDPDRISGSVSGTLLTVTKEQTFAVRGAKRRRIILSLCDSRVHIHSLQVVRNLNLILNKDLKEKIFGELSLSYQT